jgi:hypothetical protein
VARNPLYWSIQSTKRNDRWLLNAYARVLGTKEHPRGDVLSIYRKYRRQLEDVLTAQRMTMLREIREILADARRELNATAMRALRSAAERGVESAREQTQLYRDDGLRFQVAGETPDLQATRDAWMLAYEQQAATVDALARNGSATVDTVLGGPDRMGLFQPAPVQREGSRILPEVLSAGFVGYVFGLVQRREQPFGKQAIAAIDSRTTETCLNIHGQRQPMSKKFRVVGTPRFSRRKDWSPFHWYCRTSVVLYREEYDDGLTERMQSQSEQEQQRRKEAAEKARKAKEKGE